jgi:hypothetical protein
MVKHGSTGVINQFSREELVVVQHYLAASNDAMTAYRTTMTSEP